MDLNLVRVLDALLQEESVTGAARRLNLTAPAVSRSLNRLRHQIGDPLLVRAGRHLVPTPVAQRLRDPVHDVLAGVYEVLKAAGDPPDEELEAGLVREFTVRAGPDNASGFGPALVELIQQRAPGVRIEFSGDCDDPVAALRDGSVDLVVGGPPIDAGNETLHREILVTDVVVVVARRDGELARRCGDRAPTLDELADLPHVNRSPRSVWHDVLDRQLAAAGLTRRVVATTPGFAAAFALVRRSDYVCLAPLRLTGPMRGGLLATWPTPAVLPELVIEQAWHHRSHTDPEYRWLRARVREAAAATAHDLEVGVKPRSSQV
ncbi:LysR family transcriptional regulator [Mycobacterium sp. 236(2023)]|uniref:LysR family transcriptional regulator n=1 Tax=Mycobacterium sp. 236(2023) TaxID=3038163 RepID=UPI002415899C|nr:LysR family transcriptional regulator [Mycobacterium sp. 236(2023)]MDG4665512.1 LysR family transcriptional regulator [Mycobacterium sp. 236(2023)]